MEESFENLETFVDYIEEGTESVVTLENLRKVIKDRNNFSYSEVQLIDLAMESIRIRLGFEKASPYAVAIEDYNSSKKLHTGQDYKVALESSIVDTIKRIWKRIKEFFAKLFGTVTKEFDRRKSEQILDRIDELKKIINQSGHRKLKSEELQTSQSVYVAHCFNINGEANFESFKEIGEQVTLFCLNLGAAFHLFDTDLKSLHSKQNYEDKISDIKELKEKIAFQLEHVLKFKETHLTSSFKGRSYHNFPANVSLEIGIGKRIDSDDITFNFVENMPTAKNNASSETCKALNPREIDTVLQILKGLMNRKAVLRENMTHFVSADKMVNSIIEELQDEHSRDPNPEPDFSTKLSHLKIQYVAGLSNLLFELGTVALKGTRLLDSMVQHGLVYAEISEKNLE